mgnify:CR=1 FL=1
MKTEIALGTWEFGGGFGFWENQRRTDSLKTLHQAIRNGITAFDTAPSYGNGQSEQILGQQLKRFPIERKRLFIASKTINGLHLGESLHRLCTSYLDVWYLHYPMLNQKEILREMLTHPEVKAIGICNIPLAALKELKDLNLSWIQIPCNLIWNKETSALKEYCHANGIRLSGYSPLALGLLSGNHDEPPDDARKNLYCYRHPKAFRDLTELIRKTAKNHEASPSQISIAWSLAQAFDQLILGARTKEQLGENLLASHITLSPPEMDALDSCSRDLSSFIPDEQENLFNHRWKT